MKYVFVGRVYFRYKFCVALLFQIKLSNAFSSKPFLFRFKAKPILLIPKQIQFLVKKILLYGLFSFLFLVGFAEPLNAKNLNVYDAPEDTIQNTIAGNLSEIPVDVTKILTCPAPMNVRTSSTSKSDEIYIDWYWDEFAIIDYPANFDIQYKATSDTGWINFAKVNMANSFSHPYFTFKNSIPCSEYLVRVRTICSSTELGDWVYSNVYKPRGCNLICPQLISYSVEAVNDSTETFKWTLTPGSTPDIELQIETWEHRQNVFDAYFTTESSVKVSLLPCQTYTAYLKSFYCDGDSLSDFIFS